MLQITAFTVSSNYTPDPSREAKERLLLGQMVLHNMTHSERKICTFKDQCLRITSAAHSLKCLGSNTLRERQWSLFSPRIDSGEASLKS